MRRGAIASTVIYWAKRLMLSKAATDHVLNVGAAMPERGRMQTDLVGIFYSNQDYSQPPAYSISREQARELKNTDQGWFVNHGKDFCLKQDIRELDNENLVQPLKARDRSAQMPPSITEQYVDGHKSAVAIVEAWA